MMGWLYQNGRYINDTSTQQMIEHGICTDLYLRYIQLYEKVHRTPLILRVWLLFYEGLRTYTVA